MSGIGRLLRGENNIDFARWWRRGAVVSVVAVIVSLIALFTAGLNLGVEFTGGVSVEAPVTGVTSDQARTALNDAGLSSARVQVITSSSGDEVLRVQTASDDPEADQRLREAVAGISGADPADVSVTAVSASWGADVTGQAARALVFFLLAILLYITVRLEFRMAIGAIVATVHDIVITLGVYAIFQFEVSPGTVVAFLMVLGYSIYDTVVIYDKVKEGEPLVGIANRMSYADGASRSMNLVLLRSLNTSITSLLPVIALLVIGGQVLGAVSLNQFTTPLAVGLVVGTYSSIMVATYVVVLLKEREPRYRQLRDRLAGSGAGAGNGGVSGSGRAADNEGDGSGSGTATTTSGPGRPVGAIPPRPRKNKRRS